MVAGGLAEALCDAVECISTQLWLSDFAQVPECGGGDLSVIEIFRQLTIVTHGILFLLYGLAGFVFRLSVATIRVSLKAEGRYKRI